MTYYRQRVRTALRNLRIIQLREETDMTLQQIGHRLGLSKERVRQIELKDEADLRKRFRVSWRRRHDVSRKPKSLACITHGVRRCKNQRCVQFVRPNTRDYLLRSIA